MSKPTDDFAAFLNQVRARLEQGRRDFGDSSLDRPAPELVAEIQEELADVCGWSAILWSRLQRLREAAERAEYDTIPRNNAVKPDAPRLPLVGPDRDRALDALGGRPE